MHNIIKNTALTGFALLISFLILEGLTRFAYPIQYGHKFFDQEGTAISPFDGPYGLTPQAVFWQNTQEFNKHTTHTARGYRGPEKSFMDTGSKKPDVIFIGDSMTYGIGLSDTETIPYQFCNISKLKCINLGRPGTSTTWQVQNLDTFLKNENIRPKNVYLIMNVMSTAQFGGNDLTDNAVDAAQNISEASNQTQTSSGFRNIAYKLRKDILEHSNLARLVFYVFAPTIRNIMAPALSDEIKQNALEATKIQLQKLQRLSNKYRFKAKIILVHPMQDLTRQSYPQTIEDMKSITPETIQLISTAEALTHQNAPQEYYYPLDGHVTAEAAQRIAAHIKKILEY